MKNLWASVIGIMALGIAESSVLASDQTPTSMSLQSFIQSPVEYRSDLLLPPGTTFFQVNTINRWSDTPTAFSIEKLQPIANTFRVQSNSSQAIPFLPSELVDAFAVNGKPSNTEVNPIGFFQVPPLDFNAKVRIGRD